MTRTGIMIFYGVLMVDDHDIMITAGASNVDAWYVTDLQGSYPVGHGQSTDQLSLTYSTKWGASHSLA